METSFTEPQGLPKTLIHNSSHPVNTSRTCLPNLALGLRRGCSWWAPAWGAPAVVGEAVVAMTAWWSMNWYKPEPEAS